MTQPPVNALPFWHKLSPADQQTVIDMARQVEFAAGETIFAEGDTADTLYIVQSGRVILSENARPIGDVPLTQPLDIAPVLGLLTHTQRAVSQTKTLLWAWEMPKLLQLATISQVILGYMGEMLIATNRRLTALEAPIHYLNDKADLSPGPFEFNNTTMLIAFCEADLSSVRDLLPDGLSLFRPAWRNTDSLFLAVADFRDAYPEHRPDDRFSYTETTYFVPVRCGTKFGLFPAYIYPSTYEPILLGREIYGFPKRLGRTQVDSPAALSVNGETHFTLTYDEQTTTTEPRLIRALSDWLGVQGRITETAFRIGDTLLDVMRVGLHRRVNVFNHKRIPSAETKYDERQYSVDEITQAIFTVMKWHEVYNLPDAELTLTGGPLRYADVQLREAYLTRLDMRLSTGRVVSTNF